MVYTCTPKLYDNGKCYESVSLKMDSNEFNNIAYNHFRCNWAALKPAIESLRQKKDLGPQLCKFVTGAFRVALVAAADLRLILLRSTNLADFNTKEVLWHCILLREAYLYVIGGRVQDLLRFRAAVFQEPLFGDGALEGIRTFYPRATKSSLKDVVADLRAFMSEELDVQFAHSDSLQWCLCMLSKTLNYGYNRTFSSRLLTAEELAQWYDRVSSYPAGDYLFVGFASLSNKTEEWHTFVQGCKDLREAINNKLILGTTSCRACWKRVGIRCVSSFSSKYSHECFKARGAACEMSKKMRK